MARSRAKDYDDKRAAILAAAARVFADGGYDRTPMAALAAECGVSKALLYHYYASKEALLFDILDSHLTNLVSVVEAAPEAADPTARLRGLISALLEAYRDADAEHKLQLNALSALPEAQQAELRAIQRRLVALFSDAVLAIRPELRGSPRLKPATMALFGMLNWYYTWRREDGPVTREDYAAMVAAIFTGGIGAVA